MSTLERCLYCSRTQEPLKSLAEGMRGHVSLVNLPRVLQAVKMMVYHGIADKRQGKVYQPGRFPTSADDIVNMQFIEPIVGSDSMTRPDMTSGFDLLGDMTGPPTSNVLEGQAPRVDRIFIMGCEINSGRWVESTQVVEDVLSRVALGTCWPASSCTARDGCTS